MTAISCASYEQNRCYRKKVGKTIPPPVRSDLLFGVSVVSVNGFRSGPKVNVQDDMVRITLDMPKHTWHELQRYIPAQPIPPAGG